MPGTVCRLLAGVLVATAPAAAVQPQNITVGVVHFRAAHSPADNMASLARLVRVAASRGATVLVLPDYPILPHVEAGRGEDRYRLWTMASAQATRRFSSLAKELRVWIALTLPHKSPAGGVTRSCIVFSDRGTTAFQSSGPDPVSVPARDYVRLGITTSQNLTRDAERLARLGARLLMVPSSGVPTLGDARRLAVENGVHVLIASRDAASPSAIVASSGAVIAEASGVENTVLTAALADAAADPVPLGLPADATPARALRSNVAVQLGRSLFFDKNLSADGRTRCADCHNPATAYGGGTSNAPSLLNAAWYVRHGRRANMATLEEAVMHRDFGGTALESLRRSTNYGPVFAHVFGSEQISNARVAAVLASFVRTLRSANSAFDRSAYGGEPDALTPRARRGMFLFARKAHCGSCHNFTRDYALFTDNGTHSSGIGPAPGVRYRTPMLRDVALTAPYMHDGSLRTLSEVVEFYDRGGHGGATEPQYLSASEREDLVAFLESLTGHPASRSFDLETRSGNAQHNFVANEWRR